jgi:hypothetical protein
MREIYVDQTSISWPRSNPSAAIVIKLLIRTTRQEPWRDLDPEVADVIEPELSGIADEILNAIGHEIPEYARPLEGSFGRAVHRGVDEALGQFMGLVREPDRDRRSSRKVYVILGRGEYRQGRPLDSLQSAYRIGARIAWRRIAAASLEAGLDGKTLSLLAESIFVYIDELSADSTDGYAEAQFKQQGARLRRERQLVTLMLREPSPDPEELQAAARIAAWQIPKSLAAVACHERDLAEVTRVLPIGVISATVDGYGCIAVPDPRGPGRHQQVSGQLIGRISAMGPTVAPGRLAESWQLARIAFDAAGAGALPADGLIQAEDHLVDLALYRSRDLIARLREQTMAPIGDLTPKAHARMAETALAYVENSGNAAEMARSLNIHPQTARYRIARLR